MAHMSNIDENYASKSLSSAHFPDQIVFFI